MDRIRNRRFGWRRLAAGAMVLGLVAAACGDDDDAPEAGPDTSAAGGAETTAAATETTAAGADTTAGATETTAGSTETTAAEEETGGEGSVLVVGLSSPPPTLNRNLNTDAATANVALAVYDGLVGVSREQEIIPELAESWEISDDNLTYTFNLQQGVNWHDGEPFTADDVVFTFEELLPLTPSFSNLDGLIESVVAVDDHTVEVTLTRPHAPFLTTLIPSLLVIQPKHIYEGTDPLTNEYNEKPIGTGAFMFESWEGDTITLVRNEDYFGGRPGYETVIFQVVPDPTSRANALRGGEIDFLSSNDVNATVLDLVGDDDTIHLERGRATRSMGTLYFNNMNPPLDNPEVRKALYTALDKELLAQAIDPDGATIPVSGIASNSPFSAPDDVDYRELFAYDPAKAEEMLDAAGFPRGEDGTRFNLTHRYISQAAAGPNSAPIIADNWGDIGVNVEVIAEERAVGGPAIYEQHAFDTALNNLSARLDPVTGFVPRYQCMEEPVINQNPTGYCNQEFEDLTAQVSAETDFDARFELFRQMQQIIADDMPASPIVELDDADAIRADLGGLEEFFNAGEGSQFRWEALQPPS